MYNKFKKNMPTVIISAGFIIFLILCFFVNLYEKMPSDYSSFVMAEQLLITAITILTECLIGGLVFKILLKKEKSSDRDFEQKK